MKSRKLEDAFREWHFLYGEYARAGEYFAAVSHLAEMENCLPLLSRRSQAEWRARIDNEPLPADVVNALAAQMDGEIQRIRRILAFGTVWNHDELLTVCTTRIQIELLLDFLNKRGQLAGPEFTPDDVDEDMTRIARSKENRQALGIAVNLIRKNWGLPITSRWLDALCEQRGA